MKRCLTIIATMAWIFVTMAVSQTCQPAVEPGPARVVQIERLSWLTGYWQGALPDGSKVEQFFSPPKAGLMSGIFRLQSPKGEQMYELFILRDTDKGPELRVRHFMPDFTPMAAEEEPIILQWSGTGADCIQFVNEISNVPKRSMLIRKGDKLTSWSEILRKDGTPYVISADWRRIGNEIPLVATKTHAAQSLEWLTGHWSGQFNGGDIEQWWLSPMDGVTIGAMRFVKGDQTRMIEFYGGKHEDGTLHTYTWQFQPDLRISANNPMIHAIAAEETPSRQVFRIHGQNIEATTTITHHKDRMREEIVLTHNGQNETSTIDFKRAEHEAITQSFRKGDGE